MCLPLILVPISRYQIVFFAKFGGNASVVISVLLLIAVYDIVDRLVIIVINRLDQALLVVSL